MRSQLKDLIGPLIITLILLIFLEIISTAVLPVIGLRYYIIPFNILIVLYMGFKLQTLWLPVMIAIVQYFFAFFSIQGWEPGTVAGILICLIISYLRELIHFTSAWMTILVTQIFQSLWFVIVSMLIYMKVGDWNYIIERFWRFLPESLVISLLAPLFFAFFDKIWSAKDEGTLGEEA